MDNIAKLTHFHNKTAVEDGEASTDKRNEMTWEQYNQRRQQLKKEVNKIKKERSQIYKDQSRQHISAYGSQQKAMKEELINQLKYSRNKNSL
jgi:3-phenylpropionate/cinnamic acid dioxygenase small subunit